MTNAEKLIAVATKEIGVTESPAGSNNVKYNTDYYGSEVSGDDYPWCVVFLYYCFKKAGLSKYFYSGKETASCTTLRDYYKANGQLVTSNYQPGDIVFLDFTGKKKTCQHVGLVTGMSGTTFLTIEGNTGSTNQANGGAVMARERAAKYVVSVARPFAESTVCTKYSPSATAVRSIQKLLNTEYTAGLAIDGSYGSQTKRGLIRAFQVDMNTLYSARLDVDGVWGPKSSAKFQEIQSGDNGSIVKLVQCAVALKYCSLDIDGEFGAKTKSAVVGFQKQNNLDQDGVVGKLTIAALLK